MGGCMGWWLGGTTWVALYGWDQFKSIKHGYEAVAEDSFGFKIQFHLDLLIC